MVKIKTDDILAFALLLVSIVIFTISLSFSSVFLKLIGIIGSILIFIAEGVFLMQKWRRKN